MTHKHAVVKKEVSKQKSARSVKRRSTPNVDKISARVKQLREALNESQRAFAERLGVSHARVWSWETSKSLPTPSACIKLGNIAANASIPELAIVFWGNAGVSAESLLHLLPKIEDLVLKQSADPGLTVPILKTIAFVGSPQIAPTHEVEQWVVLPAPLREGPAISCLRVSDSEVLVISSRGANIEALVGDVVAAFRFASTVEKDLSSQLAAEMGFTPIASFEQLQKELNERPRYQTGREAKAADAEMKLLGDATGGVRDFNGLGLHTGVLLKRDLGEKGSFAELGAGSTVWMYGSRFGETESPAIVATKFHSDTYIVEPQWKILGRVIGWLRIKKESEPK